MGYGLGRIRVRASMVCLPAVLVLVATPAVLALNPLLPPNLIWLAYLILVVLASVRWGLVGAAAASIIAALAGDFFFTQPYYSFWIDDPRDAAALLLFLLTALGSAAVIAKGRQANHKELDSALDVHRPLLELFECQTSSDVVALFNRWVWAFARGQTIFIHAPLVGPELALVPDEIHPIAIEMCEAKSDGIRTIATAASKRWFLKQVRFEHTVHGILAVETKGDANDQALVEAAITIAAMRVSDLARRETLTGAAGYFLGAEFSQRWGTHVTTILGAANVLQMRVPARADRVEHTLLADINDETVHLGRLLRNAFAALQATVCGTQSRLDWVDPTDLLASTLAQKAPCASAVVIKTTIENDLPLIEVDTALFAEGCGQLLSDELRSSPPKSMITVDVHRVEKDVAISISREPSREATDEDGMRVTTSQSRAQNPSNSSEIGMWIASSLVRAAGAIFIPASQHSLYGPIATLRFPIRPASQPIALSDF